MQTFEIKARAGGREEYIPIKISQTSTRTAVKEHFRKIAIDKASPRGQK